MSNALAMNCWNSLAVNLRRNPESLTEQKRLALTLTQELMKSNRPEYPDTKEGISKAAIRAWDTVKIIVFWAKLEILKEKMTEEAVEDVGEKIGIISK